MKLPKIGTKAFQRYDSLEEGKIIPQNKHRRSRVNAKWVSHTW